MQGYPTLSYGEVKEIVTRLLEEHDIMSHNKEVDFSFGFEDVRIRANLYYERGNPALA